MNKIENKKEIEKIISKKCDISCYDNSEYHLQNFEDEENKIYQQFKLSNEIIKVDDIYSYWNNCKLDELANFDCIEENFKEFEKRFNRKIKDYLGIKGFLIYEVYFDESIRIMLFNKDKNGNIGALDFELHNSIIKEIEEELSL